MNDDDDWRNFKRNIAPARGFAKRSSSRLFLAEMQREQIEMKIPERLTPQDLLDVTYRNTRI